MASKKLKKIAKLAALAAAAYGASKLGKKRLGADKLTEGDIGIGLRAPRVDDYNYTPKRYTPDWGDPDPGPTLAAKGGRIGAKGGGFAKRRMGAAFKKGGHVKSMGIAKRGRGAAKR